ncbi:MAG: PfkB family carbohydrate kinase, partial [Pseudomonadota bacterium]
HVARARLVLATGTALARAPSRDAALTALEAAPMAVLDLDYRPYSWASVAEASEVYGQAAAQADIVVGNDEEFAILAGASDPREHAARMGKTVLFKEGVRGCTAFVPGEPPLFLPAFKVTALKPFGAGDAFLGGTLAALLAGRPLKDAMVDGAAGAALVVTRPGCASAMPTPAEVTAFLSEHEAR